VSWLPCFGKYNDQKIRCKWICEGISQFLWVYAVEELCEKCKRETKRSQAREQEHGDRVGRAVETVQRALERQHRITCYGFYNDSYACTYCELKTDCFQCRYGAASTSAIEPTDSYYPGVIEPRTEGVSDMTNKDLATRMEKAQELEAVSVGNDFMVKSSKRQGGYMVTAKEEGGYHCACMDYATHRGDKVWKCKHIIAVELYLENRGPTNSDSRYDIIDIK